MWNTHEYIDIYIIVGKGVGEKGAKVTALTKVWQESDVKEKNKMKKSKAKLERNSPKVIKYSKRKTIRLLLTAVLSRRITPAKSQDSLAASRRKHPSAPPAASESTAPTASLQAPGLGRDRRSSSIAEN